MKARDHRDNPICPSSDNGGTGIARQGCAVIQHGCGHAVVAVQADGTVCVNHLAAFRITNRSKATLVWNVVVQCCIVRQQIAMPAPQQVFRARTTQSLAGLRNCRSGPV